MTAGAFEIWATKAVADYHAQGERNPWDLAQKAWEAGEQHVSRGLRESYLSRALERCPEVKAVRTAALSVGLIGVAITTDTPQAAARLIHAHLHAGDRAAPFGFEGEHRAIYTPDSEGNLQCYEFMWSPSDPSTAEAEHEKYRRVCMRRAGVMEDA